MVSFWPWKEDTSSPASFERALSKLSTQITSATLTLETTRSRARRLKGLWTLYTIISYLIYTMILALVLGPQRWGPTHYAGLGGAPVVIFAVRKAMALFFDWRVSHQQSHLDTLQQQRENKIAAFKKATKYDSTQELLQKYGGTPKQSSSKSSQPQQGTKRKINTTPQQGRTGIAPPPTANIPGRTPTGSALVTPQRPFVSTTPTGLAGTRSPPSAAMSMASPSTSTLDEPGFAPNAFPDPPPPQSRSAYDLQTHWYDRLMDMLLGEDENLAKNRLALMCSNCRLVNGQAPPGVRTLEELGKWKCGSCGAWNGVENEGARMVKEIKEKTNKGHEGWEKTSRHDEAGSSPETREPPESKDSPLASTRVDGSTEIQDFADSEEDVDQEQESEEEPEDSKVSEEPMPRRSTRNASKQKAKAK